MAKQTTRSRNREYAAPAVAPRKKSKSSVVQTISHSPIRKPTRNEAKIANDAHKSTKIKQTVSAAGVFKRAPKQDIRSNKHRKRREPTPEPGLLYFLDDGIAEARTALGDKAKATFDDVHAKFTSRLAATRAEDEACFQLVAEAAKTLSAPLSDEQVETETRSKDGIRVVDTVQIGKRVATFSKIVEREETKLQELWKQWDEVQNEYLELGIEVFGREVFGVDTTGLDRGFKRDMELLDLELKTRVEEMEEEIESLGPEILKKMKASEKELDASAKKDQARLLQALL